MTTFLYRFDGVRYSAGVDEWGDPLPYKGRREIRCSAYPIIKRTMKGAWIYTYDGGGKKFVNLTARKQFACLTKQLALESFIARKQRQIKILNSQLDDAKTFLAEAVTISENKDDKRSAQCFRYFSLQDLDI